MQEKREVLIKALEALGSNMKLFGENAPYNAFSKLIDESHYQNVNETIAQEHFYNGWFTEEAIRSSLTALADWLHAENLKEWTKEFRFTTSPRKVGLIMAGNIPLVGFHDFLSILLTGHHAKIKLSSSDKHLFPMVLKLMELYYPEINEHVEIDDNFKNVSAVIATGSDNSARYFEKYFGHLPTIIRKNRTSVGVLKGDETEETLYRLGTDIFKYYGLGCRNISQLLIPADFDLDRLFKAILPYADIVNHNKYANNYDYYKAVCLMSRVKLTENGFLLTKESDELFAPISVLNIKRYEQQSEVDDFLAEHEEQIQVVIGEEYTPFGTAQCPTLTDYADGINTLTFLESLSKEKV